MENKCLQCRYFLAGFEKVRAKFSANIGWRVLKIDGFCRLSGFAIIHRGFDAYEDCKDFDGGENADV